MKSGRGAGHTGTDGQSDGLVDVSRSFLLRARTLVGKLPFLALLWLAAGCATFQPRPLSPAESSTELESRRLDDLGLKQFVEMNLNRQLADWPPASWDLSLLTLAAFYFHPDLDVARAKWGVAEAAVVTAGARPNPTFSFAPEYVTHPLEPGVAPWIWGFRLDIPIETLGKRGYRVARATELGDAARSEIAMVAWSVRSRLWSAVLDLYAAESVLRLRRNEQAIQRELLQLVEHRFVVGEASEPDTVRQRLALDRAELSFAEAERRRAESFAALAAAIGVPVAALEHVTIDFSAFQHPSRGDPRVAELRRRALVGRADVQAALANYKAAESLLGLQVAKQYPDVQVSPGYTWERGANRYVIGASLTLPVLNQNEGPIAEAEAERKQAAAQFDALQLRIIAEIERAAAGYQAAGRTLREADSLGERQEQSRRRIEAMFQAGETDRPAVLGAKLEQVTTELARVDAVVRRQRTLGLLEDALQRPLTDFSAPPPPATETSPRERGAW